MSAIDYKIVSQMVVFSFVALFPVINPIGSSLMTNPYLEKLTMENRKKAVKKITLYAFSICFFTILFGHFILKLFGLSIPVVQFAGGIMICKIGWDFLAAKDDMKKPPPSKVQEQAPIPHLEHLENEESVQKDIESKLFYPITFPITTGAGVMAVLFTLSAHANASNTSQDIFNQLAVLVAIIANCILIYVFYLKANKLIQTMGSNNEAIVNKLMAFLIFCVGLQIAVNGLMNLIKVYFPLS